MREFLVAVMLAAVLVMPAQARADDAAVRPLTLDAAIATALAQNPDARVAHAAADVARAALREMGGPRLPSVTLADAYAYADPVAQLNTPFGPLPFSSTTATNVPSVALRYQLFDGGATAARISRAAASALAAEAEERQARAAIVDAAAAAYYGLSAALASADVADRAFDVANARLVQARQLLGAGTVPRADVLAAETDVAQRTMARLSARHAVDLARVELDGVLGVPLDAVYAPSDALGASGAPPALDGLLAAARTSRGDLAAAHAAVDAAAAAVGEARAGAAPRVGVDVTDGNVQPAVVPGYRNQFSVGLEAVWTLFDNGVTSGRIAAARAGLAEAQAALEQRERTVETDVRAAYLDVDDAAARVEAARSYGALADEHLRLAQVRYRGGVGTQLELQDAEVQAASAHEQFVAAEASLRTGLVHVRFAAGLL